MNSPLSIRACFHCKHSIINDGADMVCNSVQVNVRITGTLALCAEARDTTGPCGPEARFLTLKGDPYVKVSDV